MQYLLTEEEYQEYQALKEEPAMVRPQDKKEEESSFKQEVAKMFHFSEVRVVDEPHRRMYGKSLQLSVNVEHIDVNLQRFLIGHIKGADPMIFG